jgi:glycosyltransferase involved in cell wall biosynthesis
MLKNMNLISVIVSTYNWPAAFELSVASLLAQTDQDFEIIIADDGSSPANLQTTQTFCAQASRPIRYVHHEDKGFRAGTIRNKAVAQSQGDYLIFVDGDCIALPDFIAKHRRLAEAGYFVPGNRVLLNQAYTQEVLREKIFLHKWSWANFLRLKLQNKLNRLLPFFTLPLGFLRYLQPQKWQKAMTCNLAVWKNDFIAINGFDEVFEGWGYEDSDLVIRLIHKGIKRKEGRFAVPVLHLWHLKNDRSQHDANYQRLMERLNQADFICAKQGVSQYLDQTTSHTPL